MVKRPGAAKKPARSGLHHRVPVTFELRTHFGRRFRPCGRLGICHHSLIRCRFLRGHLLYRQTPRRTCSRVFLCDLFASGGRLFSRCFLAGNYLLRGRCLLAYANLLRRECLRGSDWLRDCLLCDRLPGSSRPFVRLNRVALARLCNQETANVFRAHKPGWCPTAAAPCGGNRMKGTSPPAGVDEGSTLHHGTLMPTRGFRRSLGTGKSLSFDYP